MRTAADKVDVASDRRRRENVPRHILCYCEEVVVLKMQILLERYAYSEIGGTFILI